MTDRLDAQAAEERASENRMMVQFPSIKEALVAQKGLSFDFDLDDLDVAPDPCPSILP